MKAIRTPRTTAQATDLLARYADVHNRLAAVETSRKADLALVNASADMEAGKLLEELEAIKGKLQPWWNGSGKDLLPKARKSIELGGCMIGIRAQRAKLGHSFENDDKAAEALRATRYGKYTTRVKYTLDKTATLKLLQVGGKTGASIGELGFKIDTPADVFFVEPVDQSGTIAGA